MQAKLNPYISFKDNAKDAMELYYSIFGGKLDMQTFKQFGASEDPSDDNKIMHAMLTMDNGMLLMAADTPSRMEYQDQSNISVSLSGDDEAELREYFEKLSTDGTVIMPLERAPWGDSFGMCKDKFGVTWMVNITGSGKPEQA